MSHFTVAVFTDSATSVEELLAPYEEGTNEAMYLEWIPAEETMDEITAKYNACKEGSESLEKAIQENQHCTLTIVDCHI